MSDSIISKRYAKALFDLALQNNALDQIEQDLTTISTALTNNADLNTVLNNPTTSKNNKASLIDSLLKVTNSHNLTKKFFSILLQNGRLNHLSGITNAFLVNLRQHKGIVIADVTSATPLSKAKYNNIEKNLSKTLNKKIELNQHIDQEILGGLIIKVGSKMLDASLLGQLDQLKSISKNVIASC